jgi:hypothetical protein
MKIRVIVLFAVVLLSSVTAFGQAMMYSLNNAPGEYGGTLLTTTCGGTVPIPDGEGMVYIYQDANDNGPSADDSLVTLCYHPENACEGGPSGTFSFNSFPMNGEAMIGQAGYFVSPDYLSSYGQMPPTPWRFYVKVVYTVGNTPVTTWISDVKTAQFLTTGDWFFTQWTCVPVPVACVPAPDPVFTPSIIHQPVCIELCAIRATQITIGPFREICRGTLWTWVQPGCGACAPPPYVTYDPFGYTWTMDAPGQYYFHNTISIYPNDQEVLPWEHGCVTFTYDMCLPVEMGTVSFTALDNLVRVNWNTRSESSLLRFDIVRDGARIGSRAAQNNSSGASYEFTDESAENGRTYRYELVVVNLDNSTESVAQESVTPRLGSGPVSDYALYANYPNPFNPTTSIAFDLADATDVSLTVFNLMGQPVADLVNGPLSSGHHSVTFDAKTLPSGVYIYQLTAGAFRAQKKMVLMK